MQLRNSVKDFLVRRFLRANRITVVIPPSAPRLAAAKRRWSGSPLKVQPRAASAVGFLLLVIALPTFGAVREVGAIGLTVHDLGRVLPFYTNTLPFELVSVSETGGKDQDALLGLKKVTDRAPRQEGPAHSAGFAQL
jgi:hypothetical protein